jgi:hypothetical protein
MDIETIERESTPNEHTKINIGVRTRPELKLNLAEEAKSLGIKLSEHCENILSNHWALLAEVETLNSRLDEASQLNVELRDAVAKNNNSKHKDENEILRRDKAQLTNKIAELNASLTIYEDKRLLDLFRRVKGRKDTIITDQGEMNIVFNSPKDLLLALIYSYTL